MVKLGDVEAQELKEARDVMHNFDISKYPQYTMIENDAQKVAGMPSILRPVAGRMYKQTKESIKQRAQKSFDLNKMQPRSINVDDFDGIKDEDGEEIDYSDAIEEDDEELVSQFEEDMESGVQEVIEDNVEQLEEDIQNSKLTKQERPKLSIKDRMAANKLGLKGLLGRKEQKITGNIVVERSKDYEYKKRTIRGDAIRKRIALTLGIPVYQTDIVMGEKLTGVDVTTKIIEKDFEFLDYPNYRSGPFNIPIEMNLERHSTKELKLFDMNVSEIPSLDSTKYRPENHINPYKRGLNVGVDVDFLAKDINVLEKYNGVIEDICDINGLVSAFVLQYNSSTNTIQRKKFYVDNVRDFQTTYYPQNFNVISYKVFPENRLLNRNANQQYLCVGSYVSFMCINETWATCTGFITSFTDNGVNVKVSTGIRSTSSHFIPYTNTSLMISKSSNDKYNKLQTKNTMIEDIYQQRITKELRDVCKNYLINAISETNNSKNVEEGELPSQKAIADPGNKVDWETFYRKNFTSHFYEKYMGMVKDKILESYKDSIEDEATKLYSESVNWQRLIRDLNIGLQNHMLNNYVTSNILMRMIYQKVSYDVSQKVEYDFGEIERYYNDRTYNPGEKVLELALLDIVVRKITLINVESPENPGTFEGRSKSTLKDIYDSFERPKPIDPSYFMEGVPNRMGDELVNMISSVLGGYFNHLYFDLSIKPSRFGLETEFYDVITETNNVEILYIDKFSAIRYIAIVTSPDKSNPNYIEIMKLDSESLVASLKEKKQRSLLENVLLNHFVNFGIRNDKESPLNMVNAETIERHRLLLDKKQRKVKLTDEEVGELSIMNEIIKMNSMDSLFDRVKRYKELKKVPKHLIGGIDSDKFIEQQRYKKRTHRIMYRRFMEMGMETVRNQSYFEVLKKRAPVRSDTYLRELSNVIFDYITRFISYDSIKTNIIQRYVDQIKDMIVISDEDIEQFNMMNMDKLVNEYLSYSDTHDKIKYQHNEYQKFLFQQSQISETKVENVETKETVQNIKDRVESYEALVYNNHNVNSYDYMRNMMLPYIFLKGPISLLSTYFKNNINGNVFNLDQLATLDDLALPVVFPELLLYISNMKNQQLMTKTFNRCLVLLDNAVSEAVNMVVVDYILMLDPSLLKMFKRYATISNNYYYGLRPYVLNVREYYTDVNQVKEAPPTNEIVINYDEEKGFTVHNLRDVIKDMEMNNYINPFTKRLYNEDFINKVKSLMETSAPVEDINEPEITVNVVLTIQYFKKQSYNSEYNMVVRASTYDSLMEKLAYGSGLAVENMRLNYIDPNVNWQYNNTDQATREEIAKLYNVSNPNAVNITLDSSTFNGFLTTKRFAVMTYVAFSLPETETMKQYSKINEMLTKPVHTSEKTKIHNDDDYSIYNIAKNNRSSLPINKIVLGNNKNGYEITILKLGESDIDLFNPYFAIESDEENSIKEDRFESVDGDIVVKISQKLNTKTRAVMYVVDMGSYTNNESEMKDMIGEIERIWLAKSKIYVPIYVLFCNTELVEPKQRALKKVRLNKSVRELSDTLNEGLKDSPIKVFNFFAPFDDMEDIKYSGVLNVIINHDAMKNETLPKYIKLSDPEIENLGKRKKGKKMTTPIKQNTILPEPVIKRDVSYKDTYNDTVIEDRFIGDLLKNYGSSYNVDVNNVIYETRSDINSLKSMDVNIQGMAIYISLLKRMMIDDKRYIPLRLFTFFDIADSQKFINSNMMSTTYDDGLREVNRKLEYILSTKLVDYRLFGFFDRFVDLLFSPSTNMDVSEANDLIFKRRDGAKYYNAYVGGDRYLMNRVSKRFFKIYKSLNDTQKAIVDQNFFQTYRPNLKDLNKEQILRFILQKSSSSSTSKYEGFVDDLFDHYKHPYNVLNTNISTLDKDDIVNIPLPKISEPLIQFKYLMVYKDIETIRFLNDEQKLELAKYLQIIPTDKEKRDVYGTLTSLIKEDDEKGVLDYIKYIKKRYEGEYEKSKTYANRYDEEFAMIANRAGLDGIDRGLFLSYVVDDDDVDVERLNEMKNMYDDILTSYVEDIIKNGNKQGRDIDIVADSEDGLINVFDIDVPQNQVVMQSKFNMKYKVLSNPHKVKVLEMIEVDKDEFKRSTPKDKTTILSKALYTYVKRLEATNQDEFYKFMTALYDNDLSAKGTFGLDQEEVQKKTKRVVKNIETKRLVSKEEKKDILSDVERESLINEYVNETITRGKLDDLNKDKFKAYMNGLNNVVQYRSDKLSKDQMKELIEQGLQTRIDTTDKLVFALKLHGMKDEELFTYINEFLNDQDIGDLAKDVYGVDVEEIQKDESKRTHQDLYDALEPENATKRFLLFQAFFSQLRGTTKEQKDYVYKMFLGMNDIKKLRNDQTSGKLQYSDFKGMLYTKYIQRLSSMRPKEFENYLNYVFDPDVSFEEFLFVLNIQKEQSTSKGTTKKVDKINDTEDVDLVASSDLKKKEKVGKKPIKKQMTQETLASLTRLLTRKDADSPPSPTLQERKEAAEKETIRASSIIPSVKSLVKRLGLVDRTSTLNKNVIKKLESWDASYYEIAKQSEDEGRYWIMSNKYGIDFGVQVTRKESNAELLDIKPKHTFSNEIIFTGDVKIVMDINGVKKSFNTIDEAFKAAYLYVKNGDVINKIVDEVNNDPIAVYNNIYITRKNKVYRIFGRHTFSYFNLFREDDMFSSKNKDEIIRYLKNITLEDVVGASREREEKKVEKLKTTKTSSTKLSSVKTLVKNLGLVDRTSTLNKDVIKKLESWDASYYELANPTEDEEGLHWIISNKYGIDFGVQETRSPKGTPLDIKPEHAFSDGIIFTGKIKDMAIVMDIDGVKRSFKTIDDAFKAAYLYVKSGDVITKIVDEANEDIITVYNGICITKENGVYRIFELRDISRFDPDREDDMFISKNKDEIIRYLKNITLKDVVAASRERR
jgi:hypothetical protein